MATYGLLGTMVGFYVFELILLGNPDLFRALFVVGPEWWLRPWTPFTSTLSHDPGSAWHLIFNGLMLFFFGPLLERIMGWKPFVVLFMISGAVSGVLQVALTEYFFGGSGGALGASGAIMMVFGALAVLMPKEKILLMGIVPIPFWAAAIGYAALDILGALNPSDGIGNFAHLAGMAIGLATGVRLKEKLRERGIVFRTG